MANETNRTLWICGAGGMLGQDLQSRALLQGYQCLATDRDVDITDPEAVRAFLRIHRPELVVNCAAYTAVDKAETEEALNFRINSEGPAVLGACTAEAGCGIVHISTDYVLSGAAPDPLREDAPYAPQNAYGRAKAEGERRLVAANARHWILRTAWLYGVNGPNFVKTMLRLMREKDKLTVVDDQLGNPTWTMDLVDTVLAIVAADKNPGIYHCTDEGIVSWHGFATEIQRQALEIGLLDRSVPVEPVSSTAYVTPAKRPAWSALDKGKLRESFGIAMPPWQESLARYLALEMCCRA